MATLIVQSLAGSSGAEITTQAADVAGDEFANDNGRVNFEVNNGSGSSVDVTIVTQATVDGLAVADRVISVGAGERFIINQLGSGTYNDSKGDVQVTYSAVTSVTVAAWK